MGTTVSQHVAREGGTRKTVSDGGVSFREKIAMHLMGATYATGGDTVSLPDAPPGCRLYCVEIMSHNAPAGIDLKWNHDETTPKILAYDEDDTSGVAAQLSNASAALAAVEVYLRFTYITGA